MNDKVLSIIIKAQDQASKVMDGIGDRASSMGAKIGSAALSAAKVAGGVLAGAIILASKASWDQVSSVQQATLALNAYEKDAGKVNAVLGDLLKFARSDMGVLFNRKDLFAAAQSLKVMGDNTSELSAHVQIMARSVGLGLSTWEELSQIIGRVGSTGRLTGDDFDNLTKAGYRLAPALRNTNINFDQLFAALSKGIPADALAGQANTIQGLGIRLQTAFRGIGNAVLGVNADTNMFIAGGLGDRLTGAMVQTTNILKAAAPVIASVMVFILQQFDNLVRASFVMAGQVTVAWGAIIYQFQALQASVAFLAPTVQGIGSAFAWLWAFFMNQFVPAMMMTAGIVINMLRPAFQQLWVALSTQLYPALYALWVQVSPVLVPALKLLAYVAGGILVVAILALAGAIRVMVDAITAVVRIVSGAISVLNVLIGVIRGAINITLLLPGVFGSSFGAIGRAILIALNPINQVMGALAALRSMASSVAGALNSISGGHATSVLHSLHVPGFATGGFTGRGGASQVAGLVHKGEYVVPQSGVDQNTGMPKIGANTFNMYGNINLGSADAVDAFFTRLNAQKEMGGLGVGV